jgi:hypothetical protein
VVCLSIRKVLVELIRFRRAYETVAIVGGVRVSKVLSTV